MKAMTYLFVLPVGIFFLAAANAPQEIYERFLSILIYYGVCWIFPVGILSVVYFQLIQKDEDTHQAEEFESLDG